MAEIFSPLRFPSKMIFLDLGGHSLLAAKTVSELRKHNGFQDLSVLDVYRNSYHRETCAAIDGTTGNVRGPAPRHGQQQRHETSWFRHVFCGVLQFFSLYLFWGQPDQGPDVIRCVLLFILQRVSVSGIGKLGAAQFHRFVPDAYYHCDYSKVDCPWPH